MDIKESLKAIMWLREYFSNEKGKMSDYHDPIVDYTNHFWLLDEEEDYVCCSPNEEDCDCFKESPEIFAREVYSIHIKKDYTMVISCERGDFGEAQIFDNKKRIKND